MEGDEEGSENLTEHVSKKRRGTGKVPKGHDYWSKVDLWFASKVRAWGSNRSEGDWEKSVPPLCLPRIAIQVLTHDGRSYIVETVLLDIKKFREGPGTLMQRLPDSMSLSRLPEGGAGHNAPSKSAAARNMVAPRARVPGSSVLGMII